MKHALVTGGGSGIGRALCLRAAAESCHVHVADIEEDSAGSVAEEIRELGGTAQAHHLDVTDRAALAAMFARIEQDSVDQDQGLDLVFANAGVMAGGAVDKTAGEIADWVISVNLTGVFDTVRCAIPHLRKAADLRGTARAVLTASEHSLGLPKLGRSAVYTATKHGVLGLGEALRRDFADEAVEISVLCPGLVATGIMDSAKHRPDAAGGPTEIDPATREPIRKFMEGQGQDADLCAKMCFSGIERGDFLIITDPENREFTHRRALEVDAALQRTEAVLVDRRTPR